MDLSSISPSSCEQAFVFHPQNERAAAAAALVGERGERVFANKKGKKFLSLPPSLQFPLKCLRFSPSSSSSSSSSAAEGVQKGRSRGEEKRSPSLAWLERRKLKSVSFVPLNPSAAPTLQQYSPANSERKREREEGSQIKESWEATRERRERESC